MKKKSEKKKENDPENKLEQKEGYILMPDVEDIPGQEHIRPPKLREMEDVTVSSADEEGDEIWSDENTLNQARSANVSKQEKDLLQNAASHSPNEEEEELKTAIPDSTDADGEELNEQISYKDLSAKDLDIPDDFEDDEDEELGKIPGNK